MGTTTINTRFGPIFIDDYSDVNDDGKIRIYDSRKRYISYIELETLKNMADANGRNPKEEWALYSKRLEQCDSIQNLLDEFMADDYETITKEWAGVAMYFGEYENKTPDGLLVNEFVNVIGDYYIIVSEN